MLCNKQPLASLDDRAGAYEGVSFKRPPPFRSSAIGRFSGILDGALENAGMCMSSLKQDQARVPNVNNLFWVQLNGKTRQR
jgi:hypothetical protein